MKKRLIPVVAALTGLLLTLPAAAFDTEIDEPHEDFGSRGYSINGGAVSRRSEIQDLAYLHGIRPGTTVFVPLSRDDFEWEDDKDGVPITMRTLESLGIALNVNITRGDHVLRSIRLDEQSGKAGILVTFADLLMEEEAEFEAEVKLQIYDAAFKHSTFQVRGTLKNRPMAVYRYTTECTLGAGRVAVGYDNVKGVRFHLGSGVTVISDIEFTDQYCGVATERLTEKDQSAKQKYPRIQQIIHVDTYGLKGMVQISPTLDKVMYVYDDTLQYLGTTEQNLIFRDTYYLADAPLS